MNNSKSEGAVVQEDRVYLIRNPYSTRDVDVSRAEYLEAMRSVGIDATEPRDFKRRGVRGRVETQTPSSVVQEVDRRVLCGRDKAWHEPVTSQDGLIVYPPDHLFVAQCDDFTPPQPAQCCTLPLGHEGVHFVEDVFPSTSVSSEEFHEFVGIGAGELGMTPCEKEGCGALERDPAHAAKFRTLVSESCTECGGTEFHLTACSKHFVSDTSLLRPVSVSEAKDKTSGEAGKEHRGVPSAESQATPKLKAKPSFTPGPWMYRPNPDSTKEDWTFHIDRQGTPGRMNWGILIAACWGHVGESAEANARLIAAAPALYEALTTLTRVVKALDKRAPMSEKEYNAFCDGLNGADAALALANGQHTS